jgi:hypothetical protein
VVHVFDLAGHPTSSPIEGSDKGRFFAVLGPVKSPADGARGKSRRKRGVKIMKALVLASAVLLSGCSSAFSQQTGNGLVSECNGNEVGQLSCQVYFLGFF